MFTPVSKISAGTRLKRLPRLAIDLGFSGSSRSCGWACQHRGDLSPQTKRLTYPACIRETVALLARDSEIVLIVEAPLSAAFNASGAPCARGEFEATLPPRWWNLRAGAQMALAAQYFLKALGAALPPRSTQYLIEGFVAGDASGDHDRVAETLCGAFGDLSAAAWCEPAAHQLISVLDWVDPAAPAGCPIVMIPSVR